MCSCSLFRAAASETDTGTRYSLNSRSFVACRRLITSSNTSKMYTMACRKVSIFFLGEIQLSWKSCSQHSISSNPASQITFLLSSILTYCISPVNPVLLPFHKDSGQPCQWQPWNWNTMFVLGKNHPLDILQPFFPHHGHTFCDGYEHPSIGPRALSSLPPFQHRPSFRKTIFICCFRNMNLLSSAQHLGCPSRTNLCVPPQPACNGESCWTLSTRIVFRHSVEVCNQGSVIFVDANVHLGHPDFVEAQRKIF